MLPKAVDMPAVPPQSGGNITVAGDIARDFVLPKLSVRLWDLPVFRATVPKAAVNKHGDARRGKTKVGIAEQGIVALPTGYAVFAQKFNESFFR